MRSIYNLSDVLSALPLAQTPMPSGAELTAVLGALLLMGTLISLYYQIMSHRRSFLAPDEQKRRILPDPLRIRHVEEFVTWTAFDKHDQDVDRRIEEVFKTISKEGQRLDSRINDVMAKLEGLRGAFNQSQRRRPNDDD
jgi:hypothetical protein